jgi:hypothetical protein
MRQGSESRPLDADNDHNAHRGLNWVNAPRLQLRSSYILRAVQAHTTPNHWIHLERINRPLSTLGRYGSTTLPRQE